MSARPISAVPSLASLRKHAKNLLKAWEAGEASALGRRLQWAPDAAERRREAPVLSDAQLVVAREHGFASWPKLVAAMAAQKQSPALRRALKALRDGKPVILFDGEDGENEGDFVVAAERIDAASVNLMTTHGRGTLCLALPRETSDQLGLALVNPNAKGARAPAFLTSIDAAEGVTTGVSAADRARTMRAAAAPGASATAVVSPGHVFPLREAEGGLAQRRGHTEGSLALLRLAGLRPAAAICEILNEDGTMARRPDLEKIAHRLELSLVSMRDDLASAQGSVAKV